MRDGMKAATSDTETNPSMIRPAERTNVPLVDLLIGVLEYRDPYFRGNSSLVRLISVAIGKELEMSPADLDDLALAALLRDLGRLMQQGRLVDKVSKELDQEGRRRVEGHTEMAVDLLEGIDLPVAVLQAIRHHHERWDGGGYPAGLASMDIPYGARILAVADAFAAMIAPRPYRLPRKLSEVVRELQLGAGRQFDPEVVLALTSVLADWGKSNIEFGFRHHVLVLHPQDARATALSARLCSSGFLAEVALSTDTARTRLRRAPLEAIVISAELPGADAMQLIREIRSEPYLAEVAVIVIDAAEAELRTDLLTAGADVCLPDRTSHRELRAVLITLLSRVVSRRVEARTPAAASGPTLQGNLKEFPMEWLLQMLKYDGRTALVTVDGGDRDGVIFLNRGDPIHAEAQTLEGEPALCEMLRWRDGTFVVQPDTVVPERTIERDLMRLLLEEAVEKDQESAVFGSVMQG
jgi:response regulator RpfG family c-di-GMP phosphodiesterase